MIGFFQDLSTTVQTVIALIAGLLIGLILATALVTFKYEGLSVFGYPIIPGVVQKRLDKQSDLFVTTAEHSRLKAELTEQKALTEFARQRNIENQKIIKRFAEANATFNKAEALNRVNAQNLQDEINELLLRPSTGIPTVGELNIRLRHSQ